MGKRKYLACAHCGKKDGARCRAGKGCDASKPKDLWTAAIPDGSTRRGMAEGGSHRVAVRAQGD